MDFVRRWVIAVFIVAFLSLGWGYHSQQVRECKDVNGLRRSTTTYIQATVVRSARALAALEGNPSSTAEQINAAQKNNNELINLNTKFEGQLSPRQSCSFLL